MAGAATPHLSKELLIGLGTGTGITVLADVLNID